MWTCDKNLERTHFGKFNMSFQGFGLEGFCVLLFWDFNFLSFSFYHRVFLHLWLCTWPFVMTHFIFSLFVFSSYFHCSHGAFFFHWKFRFKKHSREYRTWKPKKHKNLQATDLGANRVWCFIHVINYGAFFFLVDLGMVKEFQINS